MSYQQNGQYMQQPMMQQPMMQQYNQQPMMQQPMMQRPMMQQKNDNSKWFIAFAVLIICALIYYFVIYNPAPVDAGIDGADKLLDKAGDSLKSGSKTVSDTTGSTGKTVSDTIGSTGKTITNSTTGSTNNKGEVLLEVVPIKDPVVEQKSTKLPSVTYIDASGTKQTITTYPFYLQGVSYVNCTSGSVSIIGLKYNDLNWPFTVLSGSGILYNSDSIPLYAIVFIPTTPFYIKASTDPNDPSIGWVQYRGTLGYDFINATGVNGPPKPGYPTTYVAIPYNGNYLIAHTASGRYLFATPFNNKVVLDFNGDIFKDTSYQWIPLNYNGATVFKNANKTAHPNMCLQYKGSIGKCNANRGDNDGQVFTFSSDGTNWSLGNPFFSISPYEP